MKANEILNEANIIDKLKSSFKKKPAPTAVSTPSGAPARISPDYDVPAYLRKQAFLDKQAADAATAASAPSPKPLPKMKVKKTDPRTAIGMKGKGGSPEFQKYAKNTQNKPNKPKKPKPKYSPTSDSLIDYVASDSVRQQAIDKMLKKLENISDIDTLKQIKKVIDKKLGS